MDNKLTIPISEAEGVGKRNGYSQVIITAWDRETGTTSIATWGDSLKDSAQAAEGGNFIKRALGWPEEDCNAVPDRVQESINNNPQPDRFTQGYICAVANLIRYDGLVSTIAKELFRSGVGEYNLDKLKAAGVNEHDLEIIITHQSEL